MPSLLCLILLACGGSCGQVSVGTREDVPLCLSSRAAGLAKARANVDGFWAHGSPENADDDLGFFQRDATWEKGTRLSTGTAAEAAELAEAETNTSLPKLPKLTEIMQAGRLLLAPSPSPEDVRGTSLLDGRPTVQANWIVAAVFLGMSGITGLAYLADCAGHKCPLLPHVPWWALTLLVLGYFVWLPVLVAKDFSFNIALVVLGLRLGITRDDNLHPGPITESTRTLISRWWTHDLFAPACLMAVYVFFVPVLRLLLLVASECFRSSSNKRVAQISRWCFWILPRMSKWADPGMFSYMLMYYLFRNWNNAPAQSVVVFDWGFTCYAAFIISSTVSGLGFAVGESDRSESQSVFMRLLGPKVIKVAVGVLAFLWVPLFVVGVSSPFMKLSLNSTQLVETALPNMPTAVKYALRRLSWEAVLPTVQVSIWEATGSMWAWFKAEGDLNILLCATILGVFVIAFTVADMYFTVVAAFGLGSQRSSVRRRVATRLKVFKELSMADVCLMGVVVIVLTHSVFDKLGFMLRAQSGFWCILASEVIHYMCHFMVVGAVEHESHDLAAMEPEKCSPK